MLAVNRRAMLRGVSRCAAAAVLGYAAVPHAAQALPLPTVAPTGPIPAENLIEQAQVVVVHPRRRRRRVCWWRRGRRVCAWR